MRTIKGPGIFLAQFIGDDAPFNSLDAIADRTGFAHPQYLAEGFRKRSGLTPGQFRARRSVS